MIQLKSSTAGPVPTVARAGLLVAFALLVAGCATTRPAAMATAQAEALQREREARLASESEWELAGRVALRVGDRGGSGRIDWRQTGQDFRVVLSAPIGSQAWQLQSIAGTATLEGLEGGAVSGQDAEALLETATGWKIPLDSMRFWVRGARAPGEASQIDYDGDGMPLKIRQGGWEIEFRGWSPGVPRLPAKLFASDGEASVRLAIDRWGSGP